MYIYNKDNTTFADLIVPDFFHVGIELYYTMQYYDYHFLFCWDSQLQKILSNLVTKFESFNSKIYNMKSLHPEIQTGMTHILYDLYSVPTEAMLRIPAKQNIFNHVLLCRLRFSIYSITQQQVSDKNSTTKLIMSKIYTRYILKTSSRFVIFKNPYTQSFEK